MSEEKINDVFFSKKVLSSLGTNNEIGTGLGANLIREYMFLFHGKIQIKSTTKLSDGQNHGTMIKLIFPRES